MINKLNLYYNNKALTPLLSGIICFTILVYLIPVLSLNSEIIQLLDELFIVGFFFIVFFQFKKLDLHAAYILVVILILFLISLPQSYHRPYYIIILQNFIHLKFFIIIYVISKVCKNDQVKVLIKYFAIFTLIGITFNLLTSDWLNALFNVKIDYRFNSFSRIIGFQLQPNLLAYSVTLLYIYYAFISLRKNKILRLIMQSIIFGILILLTGSRFVLLLIPIIGFYTLRAKIKPDLMNRSIYIFSSFILLSILIIFFLYGFANSWIINSIQQNIETIGPVGKTSHYNPRSFLYYYSWRLFIDHFPIGTGSATFASILSQDSPVYTLLAINNTKWIKEAQGLYDFNLGTIAAEFGLVGIISFSVLFYKTIKFLLRKSYDSYSKHRILVTSILFILLTFKSGVFMNGYLSFLFSIFLLTESPQLYKNRYE